MRLSDVNQFIISGEYNDLEPVSYRTPADFLLTFCFHFCALYPALTLAPRHHPPFAMSASISHPCHVRNLVGAWHVREIPAKISNILFLEDGKRV